MHMRNEKGQFEKGSGGFYGKHSTESKLKMSTAHTGKVLTQEHKNHIGLSLKGKNTWTKGLKHTEEWKQKARERSLGYKHTEEAKKKISLTHLGKKKNYKIWCEGKTLTKEHRRKISEAIKGRVPWNKDIPSKIPREQHYNWKGGITDLYHQIRTCLRYKQWHKEVMSIDWYKCIQCNSKKELEVNHRKPFSLILKEHNIKSLDDALKCEELWDTNNGETLCYECHSRTHTYGRKVENYYNFNIIN